MSTELAAILGVAIYKLACLAVGALFCWLGFRLFMMGIWGDAGNLDAKFKDMKLVLKSAAPGTFFAVLGAAIVIGTVWQGMDFNLRRVDGISSLSSGNVLEPPQLPRPKGTTP